MDKGIYYFKRDADVNVSVFAQNLLMVKMAGRSFGRKKAMFLLSPCCLMSGEWASTKTRIPYNFSSYVGRTKLDI